MLSHVLSRTHLVRVAGRAFSTARPAIAAGPRLVAFRSVGAIYLAAALTGLVAFDNRHKQVAACAEDIPHTGVPGTDNERSFIGELHTSVVGREEPLFSRSDRH